MLPATNHQCHQERFDYCMPNSKYPGKEHVSEYTTIIETLLFRALGQAVVQPVPRARGTGSNPSVSARFQDHSRSHPVRLSRRFHFLLPKGTHTTTRNYYRHRGAMKRPERSIVEHSVHVIRGSFTVTLGLRCFSCKAHKEESNSSDSDGLEKMPIRTSSRARDWLSEYLCA